MRDALHVEANLCLLPQAPVVPPVPAVNAPINVAFAPLPIPPPPPPPPAVVPHIAAVLPDDVMEIDDEEEEDEVPAAAPVAESPTARIDGLEDEIARLHQRLANEATIRVDLTHRVQALDAAAANAAHHR